MRLIDREVLLLLPVFGGLPVVGGAVLYVFDLSPGQRWSVIIATLLPMVFVGLLYLIYSRELRSGWRLADSIAWVDAKIERGITVATRPVPTQYATRLSGEQRVAIVIFVVLPAIGGSVLYLFSLDLERRWTVFLFTIGPAAVFGTLYVAQWMGMVLHWIMHGEMPAQNTAEE
jgi:Flp pilus assembly protein TadB